MRSKPRPKRYGSAEALRDDPPHRATIPARARIPAPCRRSPMTPVQCRAARALLGMKQEELADIAQVARATLAMFELGRRNPHPRTLRDMRLALESAGVEFTDGVEPGVKLTKTEG